MSPMIWILVPLVAIIGGFIIEYQKNKMKMMDRNRQNALETEELRKLIRSLSTRIENLEAIAAGDPENFSRSSASDMSEIEIDESEMKEENRRDVQNLANKRRNR